MSKKARFGKVRCGVRFCLVGVVWFGMFGLVWYDTSKNEDDIKNKDDLKKLRLPLGSHKKIYGIWDIFLMASLSKVCTFRLYFI